MNDLRTITDLSDAIQILKRTGNLVCSGPFAIWSRLNRAEKYLDKQIDAILKDHSAVYEPAAHDCAVTGNWEGGADRGGE